MSLVVGEIHDDRLSIVADTKITFRDDPTRTRRVFNYALPKLVILRDDLVAGYAGQGPDRLLRVLVDARHDEVSTILQALATIPNASFIVGALDPGPRLWHVTGSHVFDRSTIGRGWVGDQRAYEHFQRRYHEWPDETDRAFRLMSSMQWLLSFSPVASVGGYLTRVVTSDGRFGFVADPSTVGPWRMQVDRVTVDHRSARLELSVPDGGDPTGYSILPAVGRPPTAGALAYFVPQAGAALLFHADSPWDPVQLRVGSMAELVDRAADDFGQHLIAPSPPA